MSDHFVPFEQLRRGVEYEFILENGERLVATFDEYATAFGSRPPDMPETKDFVRIRDSEGQQYSLPREQIETIKTV